MILKREVWGLANRAERVRIARYILVGVLTFGLFMTLSCGLPLASGMPPPMATAIAFAVSGAFNYVAHHLYTFQSTKMVSSSLPRYLVLLGANSAFGSAFVGATTNWLGMSVLSANLICGVAVTILSYVVMRYVVM